MEKDVYVHAGWTADQEIIGVCHFTTVRGTESVSFEYRTEWLRNQPYLFFDPDIKRTDGRQYPSTEKPLFGFLSDCSPERWGRMLLDRQELKRSAAAGRTPRRLIPGDYLLCVSDFGRQGAFRFSDGKGNYYSSDGEPVPTIANIRELEEAAESIESFPQDRDDALRKLLACGSSLGGARPKANILFPDHSLWIAKFPSRFDTIDVGAWEMVCNALMRMCGIRVPEAELIKTSNRGSTFLSKRFDRTVDPSGEYTRIHTASARNLLGYCDDHAYASYAEIGELCENISSSPESDLQELWKRMVFNVCVTNSDDHLRNHSFLYTDKGWELSPAYDVVPDPDSPAHSLVLGSGSTDNRLENVLSVAEYFRIPKDRVDSIACEIQTILADNWRSVAKKYGIHREEINSMAHCFSETLVPIRTIRFASPGDE